jgi:hypothetical protein
MWARIDAIFRTRSGPPVLHQRAAKDSFVDNARWFLIVILDQINFSLSCRYTFHVRTTVHSSKSLSSLFPLLNTSGWTQVLRLVPRGKLFPFRGFGMAKSVILSTYLPIHVAVVSKGSVKFSTLVFITSNPLLSAIVSFDFGFWLWSLVFNKTVLGRALDEALEDRDEF